MSNKWPLGDQQGGYLFEVNPLGVQMDGRLNADGNGDASFDTIWESKGNINGRGTIASLGLIFQPFKKLNNNLSVNFAGFYHP